MCFNCCYTWIISQSCFSIKGSTRTSKQNGIYLWLKNYDHLYANECWSYASGRLKRITRSHKFGVFLLFYALPDKCRVSAAAAKGIASKAVIILGCFKWQSQLHAHVLSFAWCAPWLENSVSVPDEIMSPLRSLPQLRFSCSRISLCNGIDHVHAFIYLFIHSRHTHWAPSWCQALS